MGNGVCKPEDVIGDYRLEKLASEGQRTRTWKAAQISMARPVMLEMLKPEAAEDQDCVEAFLADVRAKALVRHPGIGAVYEAVSNDEGTFFARERLEGDNLEEVYEKELLLTPLELVKILKQVASAMLYLEDEKVAMVDLGLHHLTLDSVNRLRMVNLAVDGERDEDTNTRAKQVLGAVLDEMVKDGEPGGTRVRSLLGFMADLSREVPLTWKQIETLSEQVRSQLEGDEKVEGPPPPPPAPPREPIKVPPAVLALLLGLILIGGLVFFFLKAGDKKNTPGPGEPDVEQPVDEDAE